MSDVNVKFSEVSGSHYTFTMLCKARQDKNGTVQVFAEKLYALAHDAFAV